jgi:hypothetical protein
VPKLERALSFRAALDHKLVTIVRAFGSVAEGARQCKVGVRSFHRWRNGHFPVGKHLVGIDEAYAMAVELLNDPELLKSRRETSKKIHALASKLKLSHKTVELLQKEGLY